MDGLGLGPHGPPIPPPATFAVVPYPVRRRPPLGLDPPSHYVFVASGPDDPNAPKEDKTKEAEPEVEKTPEKPPVSALFYDYYHYDCCYYLQPRFHKLDFEPDKVGWST